MENKVSAAQSASKASAPLGPITQAAIKAYKAKQQENSSAALKLKKEKKPTPEPGLYAYKVRSANFEHGFTRFGVKNIKNNNKNNKAKPETKTNSTNHKGNKYSNKPFARPNGKPTNTPPFQRSFPNQKPLQKSVSTTTRETSTTKTTCPSLISFVKLTIFMVENLCFLSLFTLQVLEKTKSRSVSTSTTQ